jgi:hypothetical protein
VEDDDAPVSPELDDALIPLLVEIQRNVVTTLFDDDAEAAAALNSPTILLSAILDAIIDDQYILLTQEILCHNSGRVVTLHEVKKFFSVIAELCFYKVSIATYFKREHACRFNPLITCTCPVLIEPFVRDREKCRSKKYNNNNYYSK